MLARITCTLFFLTQLSACSYYYGAPKTDPYDYNMSLISQQPMGFKASQCCVGCNA